MGTKHKHTLKCRKISFRTDEDIYCILMNRMKVDGYRERDRSKYLRQLIVAGIPHKNFEIRKALQELSYEINKIGCNVNQITKNHNSLLYSKQDRQHLEEAMKNIMELEMKIIETLKSK